MTPTVQPKSFFLKLSIILFVTSVFATLVSFTMGGPTKELKQVSVRLPWVHQAQFAGVYVAIEKGFYKQAGLTVDIKEAEKGKDQTVELFNGGVDFSLISPTELISGVSSGEDDLVAVAAIFQLDPYAYVTAMDSPINTPKDFKGKILGVAGGSIDDRIVYDSLLASVGISPNEVTFKQLGFDTVQDIQNNEADIYDLYRFDQTYLLNKLGVKYKLIYPEEFGFFSHGDMLVTTKNFIESDPQVVKGFVNATLRGWDYVVKNPNEAAEISLKYAVTPYNDLAYQRHIVDNEIPLVTGTTSHVGFIQYDYLANLYKEMYSSGILTRDVDINGLFTNEFISQ